MTDTSTRIIDRDEQKSMIKSRVASILRKAASGQDIFQFWGMYGIGKTALLEEFQRIINKEDILLTYINLEEYAQLPHHLYIIQALVVQLDLPNTQRDRVNASIQEYYDLERQWLPISAPAGESEAQAQSRQLALSKVEEEFVHYFRAVLERKPIVMLFNRAECIVLAAEALTEGFKVLNWLEDLYKRTQFDERLTLILAGRAFVHPWNSGSANVHAAEPNKLSLFTLQQTIDHWKELAAGTPYANAKVASLVYEHTLGHPLLNVVFYKVMRQHYSENHNQNPEVQLQEVLREATELVLQEWLGTSAESDKLLMLVRAIAPLRSIDRDLAEEMAHQLHPETITSLRSPNFMTFLITLTRLTVLHKADEMPLVFRMEKPLRNLILREMYLNHKDQIQQRHMIARDIYQLRMEDAARSEHPAPKFQQTLTQLLYHEAELQKLLSSDRNSLAGKLIAALDFWLGEIYDPSVIDQYWEMVKETTIAVGQDEDLRDSIGDGQLSILMAALQGLQSQPPEHRRIDAFLAYNSEEVEAVRAWHKKLHERGINAFFAADDVAPFDNFQSKVDEAMDIAHAAAFFIGRSGEGPWEQGEIQILLDRARDRAFRMGSVLLPGCPENHKRNSLLAKYQTLDFRG